MIGIVGDFWILLVLGLKVRFKIFIFIFLVEGKCFFNKFKIF